MSEYIILLNSKVRVIKSLELYFRVYNISLEKGQVDSPDLPETPRITEMTENSRESQNTKYQI